MISPEGNEDTGNEKFSQKFFSIGNPLGFTIQGQISQNLYCLEIIKFTIEQNFINFVRIVMRTKFEITIQQKIKKRLFS